MLGWCPWMATGRWGRAGPADDRAVTPQCRRRRFPALVLIPARVRRVSAAEKVPSHFRHRDGAEATSLVLGTSAPPAARPPGSGRPAHGTCGSPPPSAHGGSQAPLPRFHAGGWKSLSAQKSAPQMRCPEPAFCRARFFLPPPPPPAPRRQVCCCWTA